MSAPRHAIFISYRRRDSIYAVDRLDERLKHAFGADAVFRDVRSIRKGYDFPADLDEAWQIAERGSMKLHMADIHLHRARLFRDKSELSKARALIEACGYWRRKEELEGAEEAAKNW